MDICDINYFLLHIIEYFQIDEFPFYYSFTDLYYIHVLTNYQFYGRITILVVVITITILSNELLKITYSLFSYILSSMFNIDEYFDIDVSKEKLYLEDIIGLHDSVVFSF